MDRYGRLAREVRVFEARRGRPFPQELRIRLKDAVVHLVSGGTSAAEAARLLGVSAQTVRRLWQERTAASSENEPVALVPVVVTEPCRAAESAPSTLVLVSPSGYRVTGLDASMVVQVLRGLECS
jgi:transposase-like protein